MARRLHLSSTTPPHDAAGLPEDPFMRFSSSLCGLLPTTALVLALSSPAAANAYDPARVSAASDPQNVAARSMASLASHDARRGPESAAARAAASSDPSNASAYSREGAPPERLQEADATARGARSATVSDPENVAAHSAG
jgi:hypothetical protein